MADLVDTDEMRRVAKAVTSGDPGQARAHLEAAADELRGGCSTGARGTSSPTKRCQA